LAGKARYRDALGVPAQAHFVPFPYPLRRGSRATDVTLDALAALAHRAGGAGRIAAVILEPIQGNGGVVIPPTDFLPRLRHFCDRIGAWLIVDEIQSGCGRTGRMWAIEESGVVPDLMTVGKGIGGGLAVAAVMGRADVMTWEPDSYTSTFLTNNLNLAAATAAMTVLREEGLADRAAALAPAATQRLRERLGNTPGIAELRAVGLWFAVELVDGEGKPEAAWAKRAMRAARNHGAIVGLSGYDDNVVKLSPPLVIDAADLAAGIDIVATSIIDTREGKAT
jgi:4-aminobutyrate aminotransferase-like enzyme